MSRMNRKIRSMDECDHYEAMLCHRNLFSEFDAEYEERLEKNRIFMCMFNSLVVRSNYKIDLIQNCSICNNKISDKDVSKKMAGCCEKFVHRKCFLRHTDNCKNEKGTDRNCPCCNTHMFNDEYIQKFVQNS